MLQRGKPPAAIFGVTPDELQSRFLLRQRRRSNVNTEHVKKPQVLAHALVNHLLAYAPAASVGRMRPYGQVFVAELAPHAEHFHSLRGIGLDKEGTGHRFALLALSIYISH